MIDLSSPAGLGGAGLLAGQAKAQELQNQYQIQQRQQERENQMREWQMVQEQANRNTEHALRAAQLNAMNSSRDDANDTRRYIADQSNQTRLTLGKQRSDNYNTKLAQQNDQWLGNIGLKKDTLDANNAYRATTTNQRAIDASNRHDEAMGRLDNAVDQLNETVRYHKELAGIRQDEEAGRNNRTDAAAQNKANLVTAAQAYQTERIRAGAMSAADAKEYAADRKELADLSLFTKLTEPQKRRKEALDNKFTYGKWKDGRPVHTPAAVAPPVVQSVPVATPAPQPIETPATTQPTTAPATQPATKQSIIVQGNDGQRYELIDNGDGTYTHAASGRKYRANGDGTLTALGT